jgi:hypothetical protein
MADCSPALADGHGSDFQGYERPPDLARDGGRTWKKKSENRGAACDVQHLCRAAEKALPHHCVYSLY